MVWEDRFETVRSAAILRVCLRAGMIHRLRVAVLLAVMYGTLMLLGLCRFSDAAWVLLAIMRVSLVLPSVSGCCIRLSGCTGLAAVVFGFLVPDVIDGHV